ncbi:MAG: hypothetical protein HY975_02040 [Candidatus Kerfeldbacteria bacterium]|nr:hypothetical protein [Candidatus Kerfeldbacteria bacterium]
MWQPSSGEAGRSFRLADRDYPCIIHGAEKSGASFFTIALTADLVRQGQPVVFICAKSAGVLALQRELELLAPGVKTKEIGSQTAAQLEEHQLVTIFSHRPADILVHLRALHDWAERVMVIKNIDTLLTPGVWATVQSHRQLILSGDVASTSAPILERNFRSSIAFSKWPAGWLDIRQPLPTYAGEYRHGKIVKQVFLSEDQQSSARVDK